MSIAIGIDLGTSRCRVAVVENDTPRIVRARAGGLATPTVVGFTDGGLRIGPAAEAQASANPERTVFSFVRMLGRKYHSAETDWLRACSPFPVVASDNGDAHIHVDGRDYSPQELVSYVLESLVKDVEAELGDSVDQAVIAVPCCFDDLQRRAMFQAAKLAGLRVDGLLNATTATAISFAADNPNANHVAIADLGAGSFDVGVYRIESGVVDALAITGDLLLGGDDLDRRLLLRFLDSFASSSRINLSDHPTAVLRFTTEARRVRKELSERTKTKAISLPSITVCDGKPKDFEHAGISRRDFVNLIAEELASVKGPCVWGLEDGRIGTDDLDHLIAVGGVTLTPAVNDAFEYLFRRTPERPDNADAMAALGAARLAATRVGRHPLLAIRDATSTSTGIKVRGNKLLHVIHRNSPIPFREELLFQAERGSPQQAVFELFQGENELTTDNTYLGRFTVSELPHDGELTIGFQLDPNGILNVSQINPDTDAKTPLTLQLSGGLSDAEVEQLKTRRAERAKHSTIPEPTPRRDFEATTMRLEREALDEAPSARYERPQRHPDGTRPDLAPVSDPIQEAAAASRRGAIEIGADSLVGSLLDGRYHIRDIIADGGMGRVYRVEHTHLQKLFALKVLHPELAASREVAERFVREARAASSIDSDHVVDISDFGLLDDGTSYFVMEYLDGDTLEEILDSRGPMPVETVRQIGIHLADGLRGAHARKIVHRDLKPANVLIVKRPVGDDICKILDFGIAKNPTSDSGSNITMVGVIVGTPHYMAPEQIDGNVDDRTDIYAAGVVLYEMVTSLTPFDGESVAEVLAAQKWATPPPVHKVYPEADCPPQLEAVIMRCLAKKPDERYQTAKELGRALTELTLDPEGIQPTAFPPPGRR